MLLWGGSSPVFRKRRSDDASVFAVVGKRGKVLELLIADEKTERAMHFSMLCDTFQPFQNRIRSDGGFVKRVCIEIHTKGEVYGVGERICASVHIVNARYYVGSNFGDAFLEG